MDSSPPQVADDIGPGQKGANETKNDELWPPFPISRETAGLHTAKVCLLILVVSLCDQKKFLVSTMF